MGQRESEITEEKNKAASFLNVALPLLPRFLILSIDNDNKGYIFNKSKAQTARVWVPFLSTGKESTNFIFVGHCFLSPVSFITVSQPPPSSFFLYLSPPSPSSGSPSARYCTRPATPRTVRSIMRSNSRPEVGDESEGTRGTSPLLSSFSTFSLSDEEEENDSRNVFRNPLCWKRVFVACACAFRTFLSLVQKSCSSFRPQCCNSAQCASGRGRKRER